MHLEDACRQDRQLGELLDRFLVEQQLTFPQRPSSVQRPSSRIPGILCTSQRSAPTRDAQLSPSSSPRMERAPR